MSNNNNIPQAALDIIANAVTQMEALHSELDAVVDNYFKDEAADADTARKAMRERQALDACFIIDAMKELQKKFS